VELRIEEVELDVRRSTLGSFLAGALLGLVLVAFLPATAALAQPPITCDTFIKNVLAHQHANEGNHKGISSTVNFYVQTDACARVSSLMGYISNTRFVEYGWNVGYDCQHFYHTTPVTFVAWETANIGFHCVTISEQSTTHSLKLQDENGDTVWTAYFDGAQQSQTMDVNFTQGTMITNAERHNSSDVATAHFSVLKVLSVGSCCYASMDDLRLYCDTDNGFKFDKVSNTEHNVIASTTTNTCPG
jgi:hypothetical protein